MGLISTAIPNLVNGVSQQPYALRLASQCQEQINGYSSVVEGLRKRPATRHVKRIDGLADRAFVHTINRDANEQYMVVISNGSLRAFALDGTEIPVDFPNGTSYLNSQAPEEHFKCVTVADYTFILNNQITVKESTAKSPVRPFEALVWIKQGSYGATYKVQVADKTASYTTQNGSEPAHISSVATDHIAKTLGDSIRTALGTGWSVVQLGSTLHIKRTDGAVFTISSDDSIGDNGISVVAGKTQRFSSLPARAVADFSVEIVGDQSSSFDNYYVKYDVAGGATSEGVWKETLKGGETLGFDKATMPHALIREANGRFSFKALDWDNRRVGDLDSNPLPSFVGRKINDVFFYRNRLGFISDENIVFSRSGSYFDFFTGTATAVLDDDPLDVGVSHTKVSILRHAVPFNETLLLFSDKTQFQLGAAEILTPDTISVNQTTEYECSLQAKPAGVGRHIYFAVNRGIYTGLREYYVDGRTEAADAAEITGHVPKYIPSGVFKIAASGNEDALAVLSKGSPNELFLYKFFWGGDEKIQASWSRWRFEKDDVLMSCEFIESRLYLLIKRADGVHLECINLESGYTEDDWNIHVHLDSGVTQAQVGITFSTGEDPDLEGDNVTYIELPYRVASGTEIQLVTAPKGKRREGIIVKPLELDNSGSTTLLTFQGDWRDQPFFIGKPYEFRYLFSTFAIKEESVGGGQMTVGEGRIQVRKVSLMFVDSGFFKVLVTPSRRDTYEYVFSGRVVGSGANLIGRVSIESGKFRFPVAAKNDLVSIEIVNDSFLPCYFLSAEWEAFYSIRSQRL